MASSGSDPRGGLPQWLKTSCVAMGLTRPTEVQRGTIPAGLAGLDVLASAPTGSGKTAAFALPVLTALSRDPYGVFCLVLTPTRELAFQIRDVFLALAGALPSFHCVCCVGGRDMVEQASSLSKRPHVVIATPGRLADHFRSHGASAAGVFSRVRVVILDEADRLLENAGLRADVDSILGAIPSCRNRIQGAMRSAAEAESAAVGAEPAAAVPRPSPPQRPQIMLFSATMTIELEALRRIGVDQPFRYSAADRTLETAKRLQQDYLFMPEKVRDCYLTYLMRLEEVDEDSDDDGGSASARVRGGRRKAARHDGSEEMSQLETTVIVFAATCHRVQLIHETLKRLGIHSVALHSELPMRERLAAIDAFKAGKVQVLVATDVAGRGLDIPAVGLVINYNVPKDPADYVHRVGRTARAGRSGRSVTLITQFDVERIHAIEEKIGKKLEALEADEEIVLRHLNETTTARTMAEVHLRDKSFGERKEMWDKKKSGKPASKRRKTKRK